jgi:putative ABC transport system permease protein
MFKIAFKNLLRNTKRSTLTIMIIIVATAGMVFGLSWFNGEEKIFVESGKKNTGDFRIANKDYEIRSKTFDVSANFYYSDIKEKIKESNYTGKTLARIRFGGMVYFNDDYENALGTGIELEDKDIIGFDDYIYEGRFLKNDDEIIVGETIRKKLNLKLGDEVTILAQTQEKSIYSLNYKVVAFYKMDNSRLNRSFFITLFSSQYLLDMEEAVTEVLFFSEDEKNLASTYEFLSNNKEITDQLEIKKWNEVGMNESMSKVIPFVRLIFVFIFSILSGLSISNTMLMTVFERRHEIGLLKSLGVKERNIEKLFLLEGIYMGIFGSFIGISIGSGISLYLGKVGVNFGDALEKITTELNIKGIIYPILDFHTIILTFSIAILTSIIATYMAISQEVKKEAIVNMRNL